MTPNAKMLALVTDAFGGRGGIAQYNRDFLSAVVDCGAASSITILPRHARDPVLTPEAIEQLSARPGRIAYTLAALRAARGRSCAAHGRVDETVFPGAAAPFPSSASRRY